jgi:hypothetical protein
MPTPADDPLAQVLPRVHEGVRKSALMRALHDRTAGLPPGAFSFIPELGRLRDVVAPQIGDTRILFPEFTPHDEELHVVKLFQLADRLFGRVYPNLKAVELFLLASALYAHDWGMAVGTQEQAYLTGGARPERLDDCFAPLPDEVDRLRAFVRSEGLKPAPGSDFPALSDRHLRLYVRQTHARRGGARVRIHFRKHPAVGQALAHLCEGHWHDFATLDDPQRFPRDYEAAGETAHILALALQVRLIDLFHITDDRTPYALWRFVSPRDNRSSEEWRKHRALHGLACIDFPPGRAIRVQGFTEDTEVWAGLQDLRRYCEDQITQTLDLSARHVPQRYGLDFLKLDWSVTTGTLRPVDFAFGFDRAAMFRILSDDIYDGEREVFLRELLQNAIDAIRTRRSRHQQRSEQQPRRRQGGPSFDTTVYFTAEHRENGDVLITCRDYGVGMDEHIIRNYFTVAGVSYYRSTEFERQDLGFEPISRFGIGILSCFMVADSLHVRTYRDPDCAPPMAQADLQLPGAEAHRARRLDLAIPAVDRQFIVKDGAPGFDVGTEVSLLALDQKVRPAPNGAAVDTDDAEPECQGEPDGFQRSLKVTEYLCGIAGFVEFPIHVDERWPGQAAPQRTLVLHPDRDPEEERRAFEPLPQVHQLCREYPWEAVTAPESLAAARDLMTAHRFELKDLPGDEGYEGWVSFPAPRVGDLLSGETYASGGDQYGSSAVIRHTADGNSTETEIYWAPGPRPRRSPRATPFGVYRDGILLKGLTHSERLFDPQGYLDPSGGNVLPTAQVLVNLSASTSPRPDVSRTSLTNSTDLWDVPIWNAILGQISATLVPAALMLAPDRRLLELGRLLTVFPVNLDEMKALVPSEKRVRAWLMAPGRIDLREGACNAGQVAEIPGALRHLVLQLATEQLIEGKVVSDVQWRGPPSVFTGQGYWYPHAKSPATARALELAGTWSSLAPEGMQFLEPPGRSGPLIRQLRGRIDETVDTVKGPYRYRAADEQYGKRVRAALNAVVLDSRCVSDRDRLIIFDQIGPNVVAFSAPFDACGGAYDENEILAQINRQGDIGEASLRCLAACAIAELDKRLPPSTLVEYRALGRKHSVNEFLAGLFAIVERYSLIDGFIPPPIPDELTAVPSLPFGDTFPSWQWGLADWEGVGPFGEIITHWPLPDEADEDSAA